MGDAVHRLETDVLLNMWKYHESSKSKLTEDKLRAFGFRGIYMQFDTVELAIEVKEKYHCSRR